MSLGSCILLCSWAFIVCVSLHNYPLHLPVTTWGFLPSLGMADELVAGGAGLWLPRSLLCQEGVCTSVLYVASSRRCQVLQAHFPPRIPVGFYLLAIGFYSRETHSLSIAVSICLFAGGVNALTLHIALCLPFFIHLLLPWTDAWTLNCVLVMELDKVLTHKEGFLRKIKGLAEA